MKIEKGLQMRRDAPSIVGQMAAEIAHRYPLTNRLSDTMRSNCGHRKP